MQEIVEDFIEYLKQVRRYSEHTQIAYRLDLMQFFNYFKDQESFEFRLVDFNLKNLKSYLRFLISTKPANRSYNRHLAALKSFNRYLLKYNLISQDETLSLYSLPLNKVLPVYVPSSLMDEVMKTMREDDFFSCRESLIFELFYGAGLRLSELTSLTEQSFNTREQLLSIIGKGTKQRIVPISHFIINKLVEYLNWRADLLAEKGIDHDILIVGRSGNPISNRQVQRIVQEVLDRLSVLSKSSPHVLRHTFATHLLDNGADIVSVKTLLGHKSLSTTQIYTSLSTQKLIAIYRQAHPKGE